MDDKKKDVIKILRNSGSDLITIYRNNGDKIDVFYSPETIQFLNLMRYLINLIGRDITIELEDQDGIHLEINFISGKGASS